MDIEGHVGEPREVQHEQAATFFSTGLRDDSSEEIAIASSEQKVQTTISDSDSDSDRKRSEPSTRRRIPTTIISKTDKTDKTDGKGELTGSDVEDPEPSNRVRAGLALQLSDRRMIPTTISGSDSEGSEPNIHHSSSQHEGQGARFPRWSDSLRDCDEYHLPPMTTVIDINPHGNC